MSRTLLGLLLGVLAVGLAWSGWNAGAEGLAPAVDARLQQAGVSNAVTAVLLNFRALDTLLEVSVLLLAVVCTFSLIPRERGRASMTPLTHGRPPSMLLDWFVRRLVPLAVVLALALGWKGSSYPGGAFQAGTLLAAAGTLLLLAGAVPVPAARLRVRMLLVAGPGFFVALGAGLAAAGGRFLEFPSAAAKWLIVASEGAFMLSIASCLLMLVIGVPPHRPGYFPGGER